MRYETFRKHGYQIGSGVVEAARRQLVTQRLNQSGMQWQKQVTSDVELNGPPRVLKRKQPHERFGL